MSNRSSVMVSVVVALVAGTAGVAGCGGAPSEPAEFTIPVFALAADGEYGTHMHGREETPPRETGATGQLVLRMLPDGSGLRYRLLVANIEDVLQAHIHLAPPGTAGPVIAWLYPSAPPAVLIPGRSNGVLAEGVIGDAQVGGPLAGQGVAGLVAAIQAGNAYANVHNAEFPPGAIRGELR